MKTQLVIIVAMLDQIVRCLRGHGPTTLDQFYGEEDSVLRNMVSFFIAYFQLPGGATRTALRTALQSVYRVSYGQAHTAATAIIACVSFLKKKYKNAGSGKFLAEHLKVLRTYFLHRFQAPEVPLTPKTKRPLTKHDSLDSNDSRRSLGFFQRESKRARKAQSIRSLYASAVVQPSADEDIVEILSDADSQATVFVPAGPQASSSSKHPDMMSPKDPSAKTAKGKWAQHWDGAAGRMVR